MNYHISLKIGVKKMKNKELLNKVWQLSIPAILTQITTIAMQYIDSAMVGNLGANASAAIGLVSTSTWVFWGITYAASVGFSVQVAHQIGAKNQKEARNVVKHGLIVSAIVSFLLLVVGLIISKPLPGWLGADTVIHQDATYYFIVFAFVLPFSQLSSLCASFLQCSGDMVIPSILNAVTCVLDVVFNAIFIPLYGVLGAGIGTGLATIVVSILMFWFCCFHNKDLKFKKNESFVYDKRIITEAFKIGLPVCGEQVATSFASVISTMIIAPLGTIAIAAHSFAVTAESLCYMPGYGVESAATTLVGQAYGAKDYVLSKKFANISTALGAALMGITGLIMFIICPFVFSILTPDVAVQTLGTQVLRIQLIVEPLFGVSMVASGALRGVGDTLVPGLINLFSVWVIRLGLSFLLVGSFGLHGVWVAMSVDLCFRGLVLLYRQQKSPHFNQKS